VEQFLESSAWPVLGVLLGTASAILVAFINRKPTELQLGQAAYSQLAELSAVYRADLADYRLQRAESLKIEEALRQNLELAREEIAKLRLELAEARAEIARLRGRINDAIGPDDGGPIDLR